MRMRTTCSLVLLTLLTGCSGSVQDEAHDLLQDRLDARHEHYLHARSLDPYSTGPAALAALDPYDYAVESGTRDDVIVLVDAIGVATYSTSGFVPDYESASIGACVRITIEAGDGGDDRGRVTTEPVECPPGTDFGSAMWSDGDVDRITTDLDGRSDGVDGPPPRRSVCHSGGDCSEGGG